jgi:hypothetical protein
MTKTFTVTFTFTVDASRCDEDVLSDMDRFAQDGVTQMLQKTFPSGNFGPDQSLADVTGVIKVEDQDEHRADAGVTECQYCEEKDCDYSCDESQAGGFDQ